MQQQDNASNPLGTKSLLLDRESQVRKFIVKLRPPYAPKLMLDRNLLGRLGVPVRYVKYDNIQGLIFLQTTDAVRFRGSHFKRLLIGNQQSGAAQLEFYNHVAHPMLAVDSVLTASGETRDEFFRLGGQNSMSEGDLVGVVVHPSPVADVGGCQLTDSNDKHGIEDDDSSSGSEEDDGIIQKSVIPDEIPAMNALETCAMIRRISARVCLIVIAFKACYSLILPTDHEERRRNH